MKEVIKRAESECVVVGLSASPAGEILNKKLGFEKLAHFGHPVPDEPDGSRGGIMIRYPRGWQHARHENKVID